MQTEYEELKNAIKELIKMDGAPEQSKHNLKEALKVMDVMSFIDSVKTNTHFANKFGWSMDLFVRAILPSLKNQSFQMAVLSEDYSVLEALTTMFIFGWHAGKQEPQDQLTPTAKAPAIEGLIKGIVPTNMTRDEAVSQSLCIWCKGEAKEFRDEISKKEYLISAMCQQCQDHVFTEGEDMEVD